jgi:hypothetical protein
MSEYPDDIVKAAHAARAAEPRSDIAALAFAILAERERCAKIADGCAAEYAIEGRWGLSHADPALIAISSAAARLAKAIRNAP